MGKGFVKSLLAKYLPGFGFEPPQPDDVRAAYIPVWFIDGEATGTINKSGTEVSLTMQSLNSYMPGFSFDPLSTLSFSQPKLEDFAVPFTPDLQHQHGLDVSCLPYSISPTPLPEIIKSLTPSQSKLLDSVAPDCRSLEFSMLAAYPVLLPIYLMRYDVKLPKMPETIPLTCIVQAHSADGLAYFDIGSKKASNLLQRTIGATPGSYLYEFLRVDDSASTWDPVFGTEYGFSSIGIPNAHFQMDSLNKAISEGVDRNIQSKSNMAALKEYGVDMDHPCVRVYTKEEVDANRKFLVASGTCFSMQELLKQVTIEKIKRGEVKFEVVGKGSADPEAVLEGLGKQMLLLEEERDGLKPQWLRDWQNSRGQG
ncbi:hypothetical protein BJ322DRAFT_1054993 [Thelephora terrestris]|uniref:Uncharacterized protein n=1 Tax=Thelephora terrestris TaxID=56493 RepID=A0A9P6HHM4_9AGAM|nr:hypothetical protein BJ322DRAFT_1054993 [Thelephora terrestris]